MREADASSDRVLAPACAARPESLSGLTLFAAYPLLRPPGSVLIPHNRSCSKTFGSIGLEGGTVNADLDPTTTFVSNFTEFYCADEASGEVTVTREPAQLALTGLPFNVIQLNVAEADLAVLPSGAIVVTPYMWISDVPKSEMPMAQYGCCLNWTCPCPVPAPTPTNPRPEDHCSCPPRVQHPCAPGTFGPSTKHPKYLLRQMFLSCHLPDQQTYFAEQVLRAVPEPERRLLRIDGRRQQL